MYAVRSVSKPSQLPAFNFATLSRYSHASSHSFSSFTNLISPLNAKIGIPFAPRNALSARGPS